MTGIYVLILVISPAASSQAGAAAVVQEFSSKETCEAAGKALVEQAVKGRNYVMAWGCFKK